MTNRVAEWKIRTKTLSLREPVFMGIVNVTPDSFSDGGRFFDVPAAVDRALELIESGAGIIDLGGESTRPGSDGVDVAEELWRVIPALTAILEAMPKDGIVPVSVDTTKAEVARETMAAGAEIVNDVSPVTSAEMVRVLLETGAGYVLMHSLGMPKTMQHDPRYKNVVEDVFDNLHRRRLELIAAGVEPEKIAVDPGLGFGKTTEHNRTLVENIERFHDLGSPVLVGHSRKRFIAETFADRDEGTRIVTKKLLDKGVQIIRVHQIR